MSSKHKGSFHLYYKKHYNKHRKKALEEEDQREPLPRHKAQDKLNNVKDVWTPMTNPPLLMWIQVYKEREKQLKW